jgi:hypothetical protein
MALRVERVDIVVEFAFGPEAEIPREKDPRPYWILQTANRQLIDYT